MGAGGVTTPPGEGGRQADGGRYDGGTEVGAIADVLTIAASRPHGPGGTRGSVPGQACNSRTGATARGRPPPARAAAHLSSGAGGRELPAAARAIDALCGERLIRRGPQEEA